DRTKQERDRLGCSDRIGTQCAGDQHQNLFASLSSFLDDPASFLSCRVNLEFASSQRSSHGRSSSLHRLRRYPVFAPSDQVLAFVLSNLCLRTAFSRPDTRDMPGAGFVACATFQCFYSVVATCVLLFGALLRYSA